MRDPLHRQALADASARELKAFARVNARRDEMIRQARMSGLGVNEIARLSGLAKTTVIRALADETQGRSLDPPQEVLDTMAARGMVELTAPELADERPLVVVGCGAQKADHEAPAAELYTGQHFRACLATALTMTDPGHVRILSAKHGLIELGELVAPYNVAIGDRDAISATEFYEQVKARGELGRRVIALCSARYVELLRCAFEVEAPLDGLGIGRQRHELAEIRRRVSGLG